MEQVSSTSTNNKRIAKNTVFLYTRMALSMLVSLYTSRVVLQTLGVEDFGIYSLVGGVVVMFQFLNSSLSGATSRFLTFELGKGDVQRLKDTFSTAMMAHLLMAAFVFIVAETVGLWFISTQLVIPEGRMFAAHIVYQCSVLSLMVTFTQVPYNASIISHEKMDIFAYIELLSVFLRLGIVYLLVVGNFDKLILYAILVLAVSMTIAIIYRVYAIRHFNECHFNILWKPKILKPMLTFSGWDLYNYTANSAWQFGVNSMINIFCGVVYNAAGGIALAVNGTLSHFGGNVILAFKPQIIKQYAIGNIAEMVRLMINASRYSLLLFLIFATPLLVETDFVLRIWLGNPPEKTIEFTRLLILSCIPSSLKDIITAAIHATGRIKFVSLCNGSLTFISLIPAYILLSMDCVVESVYVCFFITRILCLICAMIILNNLVKQFPFQRFIIAVYTKIPFIILFVFFISWLIHVQFDSGFFRLLLVALVALIMYSVFTYFFVMSAKTRTMVRSKLTTFFSFNKLKR